MPEVVESPIAHSAHDWRSPVDQQHVISRGSGRAEIS